MKTVNTLVKLLLVLVIGSTLLPASYYFIKLAKLGFFRNHHAIEINQLTRRQKEEELRYLISFVATHYPYLDVIQTEKGLPHPTFITDRLIEKGAKTKNNKEYLAVLSAYLMVLKQGTGHADIHRIYNKPESNFDFGHGYLGLKNGVSAKSLFYQYYWTQLLNELNEEKWFHSPLSITYKHGAYVLNQCFETDSTVIPKGSILRSIDRIHVDTFLYERADQYLFRFDNELKKSFCFEPNPLIIDNDPSIAFWTAEFEWPSKTKQTLFVPKSAGYYATQSKPDFEGNLLCHKLAPNVGYIKIKQFLNYPAYLDDFEAIDSFVSKNTDQFEKLIVDLRGNTGGAPKYWQKIFMERFLKEEKEVIQYGAIRKATWNLLKTDFYLSRPLTVSDIQHGQREQIIMQNLPFSLTHYPFLNDQEWIYIKNTKTYRPRKPYNFEGDLVFIVDNDCFSATEDFAIVIQQTDLGKLIGSNTYGGSMVICEPWFIELPHSHLIIFLELQLAFNADGNINAIHGTEPDIRLDNGIFPTPYPKSYQKVDLLNDPWIKQALKEE